MLSFIRKSLTFQVIRKYSRKQMALIEPTWLARNFDKANARLCLYGQSRVTDDACITLDVALPEEPIASGTPLETVMHTVLQRFYAFLPARMTEVRILTDLPGILTLGLFVRGNEACLMKYTLVDEVARYLFNCGWEVSVPEEILEQADALYRRLTQRQDEKRLTRS